MANNVSTNIKQGSAAMNNDGYRFKAVTMDILINDMHFNKGMPAAGDSLPGFNLTSTSGERITWQSFGGRPVLMTVGSITCPLTAGSIPALKRLYREFGSEIEFVMVNVREAHPAENIRQSDPGCEQVPGGFHNMRRGVRVAEGARLESVCVGNGTEGSNPSLSATRDPRSRVIRREPSGEPGGGSGPTRCVGFEPGQAGNGAALRSPTQARGARTHRRAR